MGIFHIKKCPQVFLHSPFRQGSQPSAHILRPRVSLLSVIRLQWLHLTPPGTIQVDNLFVKPPLPISYNTYPSCSFCLPHSKMVVNLLDGISFREKKTVWNMNDLLLSPPTSEITFPRSNHFDHPPRPNPGSRVATYITQHDGYGDHGPSVVNVVPKHEPRWPPTSVSVSEIWVTHLELQLVSATPQPESLNFECGLLIHPLLTNRPTSTNLTF